MDVHFKGQTWKIGNPDICGWNHKDLTASLPITLLTDDGKTGPPSPTTTPEVCTEDSSGCKFTMSFCCKYVPGTNCPKCVNMHSTPGNCIN